MGECEQVESCSTKEADTERRGRREETQRWTDEDLKETGNGFIFTTHFALRLASGRGADVPQQPP